jgi:hypothetical protein
VYTCLFGGYERLLEQPVATSSEVDFVCFADDSSLTSRTWEIRVVPSVLPRDPRRSSRHPKICGHRYLGEYDSSIYIDNSVLLKQPPEAIFAAFLPGSALMGLFGHSFRDTLEDEFTAVVSNGRESPDICAKQRGDYLLAHPELLRMKPVIGGVLLRRHLHPQVIDVMETWWDHVSRYSARDQLSILVALKEFEAECEIHTLDVKDNRFWRWPASSRRQSAV